MSKGTRKPCKECPWLNQNGHSLKFRVYADKMKKSGKIKHHACHMITSDVWGYKEEISSDRVCIGSIINK